MWRRWQHQNVTFLKHAPKIYSKSREYEKIPLPTLNHKTRQIPKNLPRCRVPS
ncbi:uncharacterized protein G2W53_000810 [Senna tora]|uniref:Uncharacterized protein n=1 Tax=Senna tora TaxID=362788 RepID=A0A834XGB6_9FABA|nr:uncharacterized protein G2W53_000810 [Senna tora]